MLIIIVMSVLLIICICTELRHFHIQYLTWSIYYSEKGSIEIITRGLNKLDQGHKANKW